MSSSRFDRTAHNFLSWHGWPEAPSPVDQLLMKIQRWNCWSIRHGSRAENAIALRRIARVVEYQLSIAEPAPINIMGLKGWMVGRSEDRARPTIVFCHRNKRIRDVVRDIIKKHGGLAPGVRVNSLNTEPTEFGEERESPNQALLNGIIYRSRDSKNPCGAPIVIRCPESNSLRRATLGGVLLIGGNVRGITVDHVFREGLLPLHIEKETDLAFDEDPDGPLSLNSLLSSLTLSTSHRKETPIDTRKSEIPECDSRLGPLAYQVGRSLTSSTHQDSCDWAIIEIEDLDFMFPNAVAISETTPSKVLQPKDIAKWPLTGIVWAVTGSGNIKGQILETPSFTRLSSAIEMEEMPTVLLARSLEEPGDCGSWLLDPETGSKIGHIVAGLPGTRLAFATPAEKTFRNIASFTDSNVSFPFREPSSQTAPQRHEPTVIPQIIPFNIKANPLYQSSLTALWRAAADGEEDAVKLLINTVGVEVVSKDKSGRTPLSLAAANGHEAITKVLVGIDGVEINSKDKDGRTPLWHAAANGHEAITKVLVSIDSVDINSKDDDGRTPLWEAATNGHAAVVRLLIGIKGIKLNSDDKDGHTPLWQAAANNRVAVVKLLTGVEGTKVNFGDKDGQTPLCQAAAEGHEGIVKLLVYAEGIDVDSKDKYGRTPLWQAVANGHLGVVRLLVGIDGVDLNRSDRRGWTLLWHAAVRGHNDIVRLLLNTEGVDVTARNTNGQTLLSWAVENEQEAIVKLLDSVGGAEVDSRQG